MSEIKLTKRFKAAGDIHKTLLEMGWPVEKATVFVATIPDADAVEVVRCQDCLWFNHVGCAIQIVDDSDKPSKDDYCSFAVRRIYENMRI